MAVDSPTSGRLTVALHTHGRPRNVRRGGVLFSEGDVGERVFLMESGWVLIRSTSPGGEDVVLALRGPGEVLGELSVLDGKPRSATAVAATDVEVTVTPAAALLPALHGDHEAMRELLLVLAQRLREADRRRLEWATLDTLGRVAVHLLELADRFGVETADGILVELPLVQEDLARWIGSSREATVKALRTLRGLGIVTTARRAVTIHDAQGLRHAAWGMA